MLPSKTEEFAVTSNLQGETIALGISAEHMGHIMKLMTDLYSDPPMATVREYATNARDSHIAAGKADVPIEVATPSGLHPFLTIEDFGVGLSVEDIRKVYSQYGASTKRDSNDQQGTFGLGCKSALTYTNQFTIIATKDGERAQVVVSREQDGGGGMQIVNLAPTDAPNGVKIIIPAKNATDLAAKSEKLFRYWPKGSVLLNGVEPIPLVDRPGSLRLSASMYIKDEEGCVAVMGGVAYPIEMPENYNIRLKSYRKGVVFEVPVGSLDLPPSREALMYTDHTLATLKRVGVEFTTAVVNVVQREVGKQKTPHDAITTLVEWDQVLYRPGSGQITWRGTAIPNYWDALKRPATGGLVEWPITLVAADKPYYGTLSAHDKSDQFVIDRIPGTVFVTGFRVKFSASHRRKLDQWRTANAPDAKYFAFIRADDMPKGDPWTAQNKVVKWDVIKAEKLPPQYSNAGALSQKNIPGSYECYVNGKFVDEVPGNDVANAQPVYYYEGNWSGGASYAEVITTGTVVCLPANRVDKFKRLFPAAKPVRDAVKPAFEAWAKTLTQEQKTVIHLQDKGKGGALTKWRGIEEAKVKDPRLKKAARLLKADIDKALKTRQRFSYLGFSGLDLKADVWDTPNGDYPLFDSYTFQNHKSHTYMYLNAAYEVATGKAGA